MAIPGRGAQGMPEAGRAEAKAQRCAQVVGVYTRRELPFQDLDEALKVRRMLTTGTGRRWGWAVWVN